MNIDWTMRKVEWKSKSAKTKRLLLSLLENDSHYDYVEYLDSHSWYWFRGRVYAEYRHTNDRVSVLFHPYYGYIIDFGTEMKYIQDYSCVPVVDAMRLYREIQLMSAKCDKKHKEKKDNE